MVIPPAICKVSVSMPPYSTSLSRPAAHLVFENDVRLVRVQSDANSVELNLEQLALLRPLGRVKHHDDEIGRLGD